jgi:sugar phosphate isomerase/epimerase
MRIGIFAKTFAGSTPGMVMQAAADAGFQSVQYNMACSGLSPLPEQIGDDVAEAVNTDSKASNVSVAAISATYNMIHPDMRIRQAGRRSFEEIAAKAGKMGAQLLTVCSGSRDPDDQWRHHPDNAGASAWGEMLREFECLIGIAERHDIRIGVEPELGNAVSSAAKAAKLISTMQSNRIRIVFDAANLFEIADVSEQMRIIEEAIDGLGPAIEIAHAKDRNPDGSFAAAGKGVIDFRHYLAKLTSAGFAGDLITHGLSGQEAPGVANFLKAALS